MSPASPGGELDVRHLRASDEDRDRVIELLRVAAGNGRLTGEELDERIEVAFSARTYGELAGLTADLPAASPGLPPTPAAGAPEAAKDVVRIAVGSGQAKRDGRWVVPRRLEVQVKSGHVKLDFTQAVIGHPEAHVDLQLGSGHVLVVTRPGIWVDADDLEIGSGHVRNRAPWRADLPAPAALRVRVSGRIGSGHFTARLPRRSFWQWLLLRPRPYQDRAA